MTISGFSNTVSQILKSCKADFQTVNVLENELLRQGVNPFSLSLSLSVYTRTHSLSLSLSLALALTLSLSLSLSLSHTHTYIHTRTHRHQTILQLANHPPIVHRRRVYRRLRHLYRHVSIWGAAGADRTRQQFLSPLSHELTNLRTMSTRSHQQLLSPLMLPTLSTEDTFYREHILSHTEHILQRAHSTENTLYDTQRTH